MHFLQYIQMDVILIDNEVWSISLVCDMHIIIPRQEPKDHHETKTFHVW